MLGPPGSFGSATGSGNKKPSSGFDWESYIPDSNPTSGSTGYADFDYGELFSKGTSYLPRDKFHKDLGKWDPYYNTAKTIQGYLNPYGSVTNGALNIGEAAYSYLT